MKATREEQKVEAIKRMRELKIIADAIKQFKNEDIVMCSEGGLLYWLEEEQKQLVADFEGDSGALVYMVIHSRTEFGELYTMLYVGAETEHWDYDRSDLQEGFAFAFVKNIDDETCSEYGMIGVMNRFGGLVRTS